MEDNRTAALFLQAERDDLAARGDTFKIVTPAYNAAQYIEETLISVMSQVVRGTLYYHVQDGGSTDGTLEILEFWRARLKQDSFAASSVTMYFSFTSEADRGMYDAINKGFRRLDVTPSDILTWINADDRLPQGALATVAQVLHDVPNCRFLSGRVSILTADGAITGVNTAGVYAPDNLAAGLHDGRNLPFIMQEGTFFTGSAWLEVGGADAAYGLAGDWDLWRRMASCTQHYSLDSVTGFHRRRPGQLSADMTRYYAEVDAALAKPRRTTDLAQEGNLIRYQEHIQVWQSVKVNPFAVHPFELVCHDVLEAAVPWRFAEGFGPPEGPYPEFNLPSNVRWIKEKRACVQALAPVMGRYTVRVRLRASLQRPLIRFLTGSRIVYERELAAPREMVDAIIEFPCWLQKGSNVILIEPLDGDEPDSACSEAGLLVVSLEIATDRALARSEIARRRSASDGSPVDGAVAFVLHSLHHAERLDATLTSLIDAGAGRRSIFVEDDGDPLTREIVERFEPHVEALVEPRTLSDEALRTRGFGMRLDLMAGDRLLPGALKVAQCALKDTDLDEVVGLIDCFDYFGRPTCRLIGSGSGLRVFGRTPSARARVIGCSLFSRKDTHRIAFAGDVPRVMLHEDTNQGLQSPLLLSTAKAFALLGCETSLVKVTKDLLERKAEFISILCGEQSICGEIVLCGAQVRIALEGVDEIKAQAGHDIDVYRYVTRRQARNLFGIEENCFVIVLHADLATTMSGVLDLILNLEQSRSVGIILCKGEIGDPDLERRVLFDLRETFNTRSERYVLAAADVIFQFGPSDERLAVAAAIAKIPVVRSEQATAEFVRRETTFDRLLDEARNYAVAWCSDEAFALSLREQALRVLPQGPLARWFAQLASLATGKVEIHTDHVSLLNAKSSCSLVPIRGARKTVITSDGVVRDGVIACSSANALLALEVRVDDVHAIHLRVCVELGGDYEIIVDGKLTLTTFLSEEFEHELTFDATLETGTHSLELRKTGDGPESVVSISGVEVLASTLSGQIALVSQTSFAFVPRFGKESTALRKHGDWQRLEGFHETEDAAHPQYGLYEAFRWSKAAFAVNLWSENEALECIVIATRGNHQGQMLRLKINNIYGEWCAPLSGSLVLNQRRSWIVRLKKGINKVEFETSSTTGNDESRVIGIILEGLYIE